MTLSNWKEPVAVICGLLAAMGGITGIALTFKYANILLGICGIVMLVLAVLYCIDLWRKGAPRKEGE